MAETARYSLKELLYWLTVWSVALGVLACVFEPFGVIFFAAWFIGTTTVNKAFGYRAGFWYAALFGVVSCVLMVMLSTPLSNKSRSPDFALSMTFVLLFGIASGAVVWLVGFVFDKLFKDIRF
jgi:hypothetical protein